MILESIMNFERLQFVKINQDNPGIYTTKSKGIIRIINTHTKEGCDNPLRTGIIQVLWEKEHKVKEIHYSHLKIFNGTDTSKALQAKE